MTNTIDIFEAVALWVKSLGDKSAFFAESLYFFLYQTRHTKQFEGKAITKLRKDANLKRIFGEVIEYLVQHNLIEMTKHDYFLLKNQDTSELEIICSLYPQGYISHLSAMQLYNLTNRFPKAIDFTAPTRTVWKKEQEHGLSDYDFTESKFSRSDFSIPYPSEVLRFKRKKINVYSRKTLLSFTQRGNNIRVIEIGCLFLEMLRFPDECGGFQHVFEIYEEMGEILSNNILSATEQFGNNIDKSRIGYIFEKHLGLNDSRIDAWKVSAVSRGGSRKMVADAPYANVYDEDWCISLNHAIFAGLTAKNKDIE